MAEPKRYVQVIDGEHQGVILWDGETPYDPGPGVELIEESKYGGPPPAPVEREPTSEERLEAEIATLKAQMREVAKVPEVAAKVDLGAIKGDRLEIAEPIEDDGPIKGGR